MYKFGYDGDTFKVEYKKDWDSSNGDMAIQLPHQCDSWIIGDADNARLMIKDLEAMIERLEGATVRDA